MGRPTAMESEKLKERMGRLAQRHSTNEIARLTGKSPQAVQQYCRKHGIETPGMRARREFNVDKDTERGDKATVITED